MILFDLLGIGGVICITGSYFLLQAGRISGDSYTYILVNALGAGLVLISLLKDFNLPAFIIELFWLIISLYGFFRKLRKKEIRNI